MPLEIQLRYDPALRHNNVFRVTPIEGTKEAYMEAVVKLNETAGWHWVHTKIGIYGRDCPPQPRAIAVARLGEGEWRSEAAVVQGNDGPLPLLTLLLTNVPDNAPFFSQ